MAEIQTIHDLAALVRGRRQALGLSQAELADRAGVSRQWVSAFERGRPGSELQLILRLLEALSLRLAIDPLDDAQAERRAPEATDLDALLEDHRSG